MTPHPDLCGAADPEYITRIAAQRVTMAWRSPVDAGKANYRDTPMFATDVQQDLFNGIGSEENR